MKREREREREREGNGTNFRVNNCACVCMKHTSKVFPFLFEICHDVNCYKPVYSNLHKPAAPPDATQPHAFLFGFQTIYHILG